MQNHLTTAQKGSYLMMGIALRHGSLVVQIMPQLDAIAAAEALPQILEEPRLCKALPMH